MTRRAVRMAGQVHHAGGSHQASSLKIERGQDDVGIHECNTHLAGPVIGGRVRDQHVAMPDAALRKRLTYDVHRIDAGPPQIEPGGEIDERNTESKALYCVYNQYWMVGHIVAARQ